MNPNVISNRETILHIVHIFYNYVYTYNLLHKTKKNKQTNNKQNKQKNKKHKTQHKKKKKKKKTFYFFCKNLETTVLTQFFSFFLQNSTQTLIYTPST